MALFKINKGQSADLGANGNSTQHTVEGYAYFTPDNGKFYIDIENSNNAILGTNRIPLSALGADVNYSFSTTNDTIIGSNKREWNLSIPGIIELKDGLIIHVKLSTDPSNTCNFLNLNNLGRKVVYYKQDTILQGIVSTGMELTLIYRENINSIDYIDNNNNYGKSGWVLDTLYTTNSIGIENEDFSILGKNVDITNGTFKTHTYLAPNNNYADYITLSNIEDYFVIEQQDQNWEYSNNYWYNNTNSDQVTSILRIRARDNYLLTFTNNINISENDTFIIKYYHSIDDVAPITLLNTKNEDENNEFQLQDDSSSLTTTTALITNNTFQKVVYKNEILEFIFQCNTSTNNFVTNKIEFILQFQNLREFTENLMPKLLRITDTTNATKTYTGALQIYGGASVAKNLYVHDNILLSNNSGIINDTIRIQANTLQLVNKNNNTNIVLNSQYINKISIGNNIHILRYKDNGLMFYAKNSNSNLLFYLNEPQIFNSSINYNRSNIVYYDNRYYYSTVDNNQGNFIEDNWISLNKNAIYILTNLYSANNILPILNNNGSIGDQYYRWNNIYGVNGNITILNTNYIKNSRGIILGLNDIDNFDSNNSYSEGNYVQYENRYYKCINATQGEFNAQDWQIVPSNGITIIPRLYINNDIECRGATYTLPDVSGTILAASNMNTSNVNKYLKLIQDANNRLIPTWSFLSITLNNTLTDRPSFYAPTTGGTEGYILKSNGSNSAPSWSSNIGTENNYLNSIYTNRAYIKTNLSFIKTITNYDTNQNETHIVNISANRITDSYTYYLPNYGGTLLAVNSNPYNNYSYLKFDPVNNKPQWATLSFSFNGEQKTSLSFYAPTTAGNEGYIIKSNGSGAPSWVQAGIRLNGDTNYKIKSSFYAPTSVGYEGYILKSNGNGAPSWANTTTITNLGTITVGTWHGSKIDVQYGGTGKTYFNPGEFIIGDGFSGFRSRTVKINGNISTSAINIYAPTAGGTEGYILKSNGSNSAPSWDNKISVQEISIKDQTNTVVGSFKGTETSIMRTVLQIGNSSRYAQVGLYNQSNSCSYLLANGSASNSPLIYLPATGGTLALTSSDITGNAATATRIKGSLSAVASNSVGHHIWVSDTSSADGVPRYVSECYITGYGYLYATRVYNAVWNDYAEYRRTETIEYGCVYQENDNGIMSKTDMRLIPGCSIASDTFGSAMGETDNAKTPMAVAGRVLVYTYQNRNNYKAGMAVCSAPNGTIDIMSREEIITYPDCIIGYVSEIPDYEEWGKEHIKVNNRIWIKI